MTLLEGIAALVILGISAVGFLGAFEGSARSARHAIEQARVAGVAEAAMEAAAAGDLDQARRESSNTRLTVTVRAWRGGLRELIVRVESREGGVVELHRLVPVQ